LKWPCNIDPGLDNTVKMLGVHYRQPSGNGSETQLASQSRLSANRRRYREPEEQSGLGPYPVPMNIMYDRRVVRGSNYAPQVSSLTFCLNPDGKKLNLLFHLGW
jgi:hypothetical protein